MATKKVSGRTERAPRKRKTSVTEELQNVGADVVPSGTIEA